MALNINTTVILEVSGGGTYTLGKSGARTNSIWTPLVTTAGGSVLERQGTIAGSGFATVYDITTDLPATIIKLFFWMDQSYQMQLVGSSASNIIFNGAANDPTCLAASTASFGVLGAVSQTVFSGVASLEVLQNIAVHNLSDSTVANYHMILVL